MLTTLNAIPPRERGVVLTAVMASVLPATEAQAADLLPNRDASAAAVPAAVREAVLAELRRHLRLKPHDESERARGQLLTAISDEMADALLAGVDQVAIRDRLGQRGALPPDSYALRLPPHFNKERAQSGLSERTVRDTVSMPDAVEHFFTEQRALEGQAAWSLFMRRNRDTTGDRAYTVLVLAQRVGAELKVVDFWKIFHIDVEMQGVVRPTDAVRALVAKFGRPFRVAGREAEVLIVANEVVHARPGEQVVRVSTQPPGDFSLNALVSPRPNGSVEIALAFCIDETRYAAAVKRHQR